MELQQELLRGLSVEELEDLEEDIGSTSASDIYYFISRKYMIERCVLQ